MTNCDIAWAAGLFEGEGTWCFINKKNRTRNGICAAVYSTDLDVLERFQSIVRIGKIHEGKIRQGQTKVPYTWSTRSKVGVSGLIDLLYPWLGSRRKAKADELLLEIDDGRVHRGPALRAEKRSCV